MNSIERLFSLTDGLKVSTNLFDFIKDKEFDESFLDLSKQTGWMPYSGISLKKVTFDVKVRDIPYQDHLSNLLMIYEKIIKSMDKNKNYLFLHSSGCDSRIISGIMLKLKREGYSDFSNVHFRGFGSEIKSFIELMKLGDWTNYSILDESLQDPFNIGSKDCVGGWFSPAAICRSFWTEEETKKYVYMGGAMGETLHTDPLTWYKRDWFAARGAALRRLNLSFRECFLPQLDEQLINYICSIPLEYRLAFNKKFNREQMRLDLADRLGMLVIPIQKSVNNWKVSPRRIEQMWEMYYSGAFYKKYKKKIELSNESLAYNNGKMWGFAVTIYDKINN